MEKMEENEHYSKREWTDLEVELGMNLKQGGLEMNVYHLAVAAHWWQIAEMCVGEGGGGELRVQQ